MHSRMLQIMRERYPNYVVQWDESLTRFGKVWEDEFDSALQKIFSGGVESLNEAVDGYAEFCTDALRSQIYFEKNGKYRDATYAEVAERCYHNDDFMLRCYLPGMFLSHYIWPHHHRMLRYFRATVASLKNIKTFSEVGTGCGMYSKEALELFPESLGAGYDISPYSLSFTSRVVEAFSNKNRYRTEVRDVVKDTPAPSDFVICQEVLEHLEDPNEFVKSLYKMTSPGGYAYISAAINAGHVDHIYLYKNPNEVLRQVEGAGFKVIDSKSEYAYSGKAESITPCHAAFLCTK